MTPKTSLPGGPSSSGLVWRSGAVVPRVVDELDEELDEDEDDLMEDDDDVDDLDDEPPGRVAFEAWEAPRRLASCLGTGCVLAGTMAVEKPDMRTVRPTAGPVPKSCFRTMGPSTMTRSRFSLSISLKNRPSSRGRFRMRVISGSAPAMKTLAAVPVLPVTLTL